MNKIARQSIPTFGVIAIIIMVTDLVVDRIAGYPIYATIAHAALAIIIALGAHLLMHKALQSYLQAEQILDQARTELEFKVNERTAELKRLNESLRTEILERQRAEVERELLMDQIEAARLRAMNLVGELHLANNMLVTLIDTLPAGMVIIDTLGRVVLANSHARALMRSAVAGDYYGIRDELATRTKDGSLLSPEQLPLARALHGETTAGLEVECCLEDGTCVHLLMAASPVRDENGQITNAVKIMQDITPLKVLEKALRESEEKYRTQFDAFSEPTTVWDRAGTLLMQNLVSARNLNGSPQDFLGKSIHEVYGVYGEIFRGRIERVIDSGETESQEDVLNLPIGKRYFWTCTQRIQIPNDRFAAQIISYDVTARHRIEDAVRSSEEKFSTVFHFAPNPIGILRVEDNVFLEINQAFCNLLGRSRIELVGRTWRETGYAPMYEDLEKIQNLVKTLGKVIDYELQIYRPKFEPLVLMLSIIPILIREEECVLLIGYDMTERKRSEEALRLVQAELAHGLQERTALQERQRLARELHDSVSQALYGISLGTHTALTLFDSDRVKSMDALNYVLGLAQAGLTEMRALIFELRPESLKMEGLVNAINKQAAALRARHGIEVSFVPCEEPRIPIEVKETLYRIALEAMQNAIKHARCSHIDVVLCSEPTGLRMEIGDNGVGFDPNIDYPGHLGLQSMRERASSISGAISITSEIQHGSRISVRIPTMPIEMFTF